MLMNMLLLNGLCAVLSHLPSISLSPPPHQTSHLPALTLLTPVFSLTHAEGNMQGLGWLRAPRESLI